MDRVASASANEILARAGPAISAGRAIIISVEAIRDRSANRWPRKREQVAAFLGRAFQRIADPADLILPLNDVEFLTIQPGVSSMSAVNRSCNVLKECLLFFLGASAPEDIRLLQVTSFAGGAVNVQAVDVSRLQAADDTSAEEFRVGGQPAAAIEPPSLVRNVRLEPPGIDLQITTLAEPVWNVTAKAVVSFMLRAEVAAVGEPRVDLTHLGPAVGREIALSAIEHALQLLTGRTPLCAGLHLPIPASALSHSSSRYLVVEALRAIPSALRRFLIPELTGLASGVPQTRLIECVGVLQPFCRAVVARAPGLEADLARWSGCGLGGICIDCEGLSADVRNAPALFSIFAEKALRVGASCAAYGLSARSLVTAAWAAGFTHLGGPAISRALGEHHTPRRLTPRDLYEQEADQAVA